MRECYTEKIAPVVAKRWEEKREEASSSLPKEPKAGSRAEVAHQVFAALPAAEHADFVKRAKEDAEKAKAEYLAALKKPASTALADRQRYEDWKSLDIEVLML
jgi:hypothetical protein